MWKRNPFLGGCNYINDNLEVIGFYSPENPVEFESDCQEWQASNLPLCSFKTADAAMEAATYQDFIEANVALGLPFPCTADQFTARAQQYAQGDARTLRILLEQGGVEETGDAVALEYYY